MQKNKRNILVVRFSALGDVAMTLPPLYNACSANPDMNFIFLTRTHPAQMFINRPANLTVMGINLDNYKGAKGLWRLARSIRKLYHIDTVVDLHDVIRTKLLRTFLQIQGANSFHIRKGRKAKKELTRRHNKVLVQLKPTTQRYEAVFRIAGIALDNNFRSLYGSQKGDPAEFKSVTGPKKDGEYWMAVAPFAKHKGKIYPIEQLESVIQHFDRKENIKIFVFGFGESERKAINQLAKRCPHVVNMADASLGIGAELSLLSHCDVMLSMDSANMHLASIVGLRTVSIWGATHPYTGFLGWNQSTSDVVQLAMTCRPCSVFGDKPCFRGDYHCLRGITPQMVIQKVEERE